MLSVLTHPGEVLACGEFASSYMRDKSHPRLPIPERVAGWIWRHATAVHQVRVPL
jgi:hypothetical protein